MYAVFSYILSYGQYAKVLSPAAIREAMIHTIETIAGNYGAGSGVEWCKETKEQIKEWEKK